MSDGDLSGAAEKTWRCFHCDEVFVTVVDARCHFGSDQFSDPACRIKAAGEHALLVALRNAEDALTRYRNEDSDVLRVMYALSSDHGAAVVQAEQKGYDRGLRDAPVGLAEANERGNKLLVQVEELRAENQDLLAKHDAQALMMTQVGRERDATEDALAAMVRLAQAGGANLERDYPEHFDTICRAGSRSETRSRG